MPWGDKSELWWMDPKYDWSTSVAAASRNFMQAREQAQQERQFDAMMPLKQKAMEVDMLNAASRAQEVTSIAAMRESALKDDLRSKPLFDDWVLAIQQSGDLQTPIPPGLAPKWQNQAVHTLAELRRLQATSEEALAAKEVAAMNKRLQTEKIRMGIRVTEKTGGEFAPIIENQDGSVVVDGLALKAGLARVKELERIDKAPKANPFADDLARAEADLAGLKAMGSPADPKEKAKHSQKVREAAAKVDQWRTKVQPSPSSNKVHYNPATDEFE